MLSELPSSWKWVTAQDYIDIRDGTHDSPKPVEVGIPLVTSKNLVNGEIDFSTCTFISEQDHEAISKRSKVDNGDILYAMIGTIGNPVIVDKRFDFSIKNVALFKFNDDAVFNRYIYYFLNSSIAEQQFKANSRGGTQKFVSLGNIRDLKIPLPPLAEQKRIATILDKADAIRRKRQQAIQLGDDFLRSVFLDMFGDPVTNPKGLSTSTIGSLCEVTTGSTPSRKEGSYYGGLIPWVKTTEVDDCLITTTEEFLTELGLENSNCKLNPEGSIIIAMYGQGKTRGKVARLGIKAATNQACAVVLPSANINMDYLYFYLKNSYVALRELGQGAGQPNLNLSIVKGFPILIPPMDYQKKFASIFKKFVLTKNRLLESVNTADKCFTSLSQKAFSGQL